MSPGLLAFAAGRAGGGRGGRSQRVEAKAVIDAAGLPDELAALVLAVTKKCRLWGSERADIARELCAHFRDGLEAGVSAEELAAAFGDPAMAARLMTVSRKRLRPLWWRGMRGVLRGAAVCLVVCIAVYAVLAARFYLGTPNVSRNIAQELNAAAEGTPVEERAWPLYLEARRRFGAMPAFAEESDFDTPLGPEDKYWPEMSGWVAANEPAFETLRRAASRRVLGYPYSGIVDPELQRVHAITRPEYTYTPEEAPENPIVFGMLLPHLSELRTFARQLQWDIHIAVGARDADRYLADITAMLGMAEHVLDEPFLISRLVGMSIAEMAFTAVADTATAEGLLSDEQLRDLAHRLGAFADGRIRVAGSGETLVVEDLLQRFFSDDGNGDGRFIGVSDVNRLYETWGVARPKAEPLLKAIRPVQATFVASRAEIRERADYFAAMVAVDDALPPWRHHERASAGAYQQLRDTGIFTVLPLIESLMDGDEGGSTQAACGTRDLVETQRDMALTVLAMEAYRRATGGWPRTLADLVPKYLPSLPRDPFDGEPLRYLLAEDPGASPRLYSVGVDQVDGGGVAPDRERQALRVNSFYWFGVKKKLDEAGASIEASDIPAGDWVLWPR